MCDRRSRAAEDHHHPPELLTLVRCRRAHSETRYNPEKNQNERCQVQHRSSEVEAYFEYLDELVAKDSRWGVARMPPPVRVKVESPPEPQTRALPIDAPLNFFDHTIYNQMPKVVREKITNSAIPIAPLPHARGLKLSYNKFLRRFEGGILNKYISLDVESKDELDIFLMSDDDGDDEEDNDGDVIIPDM